MPPLDPTHEAFAWALATGSTARAAALAAGYSASTAEGKAHKIARRGDIMARVAELRGLTSNTQPDITGWQPVTLPQQQPPQQVQPQHVVPPPQAHPVPSPPQPLVQQQPAPQAPAYDPPRPLRRIDLARASRDEVKRWTLDVLHELTHEAHNARDRRVVTNAMAEISKLSGTYAPQRIDAVYVSVLDGMSRDELQALLNVFNDPTLLEQDEEAEVIEAQAEEVLEEAVCSPDPLS